MSGLLIPEFESPQIPIVDKSSKLKVDLCFSVCASVLLVGLCPYTRHRRAGDGEWWGSGFHLVLPGCTAACVWKCLGKSPAASCSWGQGCVEESEHAVLKITGVGVWKLSSLILWGIIKGTDTISPNNVNCMSSSYVLRLLQLLKRFGVWIGEEYFVRIGGAGGEKRGIFFLYKIPTT